MIQVAVRVQKNPPPTPQFIYYEAAIPRAELPCLRSERVRQFRLNFVLCDRDGDMIKGGMGPAPGIFGGGKQPGVSPRITVVE